MRGETEKKKRNKSVQACSRTGETCLADTGVNSIFPPEEPTTQMGKRTSPFCLSLCLPLSLSLWHCFSLWPSLPSCQHPSALLTLIVIWVTPRSVPFSLIDFIRAPFNIKTRSPRSLLSPHPSGQEVIRDTQWNVPVATRQDITTKIKGGRSWHCQSGTV